MYECLYVVRYDLSLGKLDPFVYEMRLCFRCGDMLQAVFLVKVSCSADEEYAGCHSLPPSSRSLRNLSLTSRAHSDARVLRPREPLATRSAYIDCSSGSVMVRVLSIHCRCCCWLLDRDSFGKYLLCLTQLRFRPVGFKKEESRIREGLPVF